MMTLHVLVVGKAFWMRPGFGFTVLQSLPFSGANIIITIAEFINKHNLFISHLFLHLEGRKDQRVLVLSEKFLSELEKRGIPFSLQNNFVKKKRFGRIFYYHVMAEDEITAYNAFLYNPDGLPREMLFGQAVANLLDSMLREPAEENINPQVREDELISLGNKVSPAHFTDQGKYEMLDTISYLCHSKIETDRAMAPLPVMEKIIVENGWVKQFPAEKLEGSGL